MKSFGRGFFCLLCLVVLFLVGSSPAYAKWWNVYPYPDGEATRAYIQAVIDTAHDGDVIYFNRGTYDFSGAPPFANYLNSGALVIRDKSLAIKGAPGSIIIGAPVTIDPDTNLPIGIRCFWVVNPGTNKDVSFEGLTFQTFMAGINAVNADEVLPVSNYFANLRNLAVRNCTFLDVGRNGIACAGVQGNITVSNNKIYGDRATSRFGIYADWLYEPGRQEWQPENTLISITNNIISGFSYSGILTNRSSRVQIMGNTISDSAWGILFNVGHRNGGTVSYNALSDIDNEGILVQGYTLITDSLLIANVAQGLKVVNNVLNNVWGIGIDICGDVAHSNYIASNRITMAFEPGHGDFSGFSCGIYSDGHDDQFIRNTIRGAGYRAVLLGSSASWTPGVPDWGAYHQYFFSNSVSGFAPQDPNNPGNVGWHYELTEWTHDNSVIGLFIEHATYVNSGINNIFRFVYPYEGPGGALSLLSLAAPRSQNRLQKTTAYLMGELQ